ncbi:25889_t:CDS:1, partial [Racocetra persica]
IVINFDSCMVRINVAAHDTCGLEQIEKELDVPLDHDNHRFVK